MRPSGGMADRNDVHNLLIEEINHAIVPVVELKQVAPVRSVFSGARQGLRKRLEGIDLPTEFEQPLNGGLR